MSSLVGKYIRNPLIIALDVDTQEQALKLATDLSPYAGAFKLGPRLVYRYGDDIVRQISLLAPVFIDCKFFDIPSTMESAVQAAFDSGATLVTIHALSGKEAMSRLADLEKKLNEKRPFRILCVTILTSWDQASLPSIIKSGRIVDHVKDLVHSAKSSGLRGIVCSAEELEHLNTKEVDAVVPGIRFESLGDDQKRTMTPELAIQKGASALVVGRPIIQSQSPQKSAQEFLRRIKLGE